MVRRGKDDGGTAVIERGNPDDIAAKIAAADAEARRAAMVADIEQFRTVVASIADGIEPDRKTLAAMGDVTRRLHLPPGAVSQAVRALQDERRLQAEADAVKNRMKDVKAREPELVAQLKAAEAKLLALREELAEYHGTQRGYVFTAQSIASVRADNPLMFAPVEVLTERMLKAGTGMSTATLTGMVPAAVDTHRRPSVAAWEN